METPNFPAYDNVEKTNNTENECNLKFEIIRND
jgi:hypothetical protein